MRWNTGLGSFQGGGWTGLGLRGRRVWVWKGVSFEEPVVFTKENQ